MRLTTPVVLFALAALAVSSAVVAAVVDPPAELNVESAAASPDDASSPSESPSPQGSDSPAPRQTPAARRTSTQSVDIPGVATVVYVRDGGRLTLLDVRTEDGWAVEVEHAEGREIEADFRSGLDRVDLNLELEDGEVRTRVRDRSEDAAAGGDRSGSNSGRG